MFGRSERCRPVGDWCGLCPQRATIDSLRQQLRAYRGEIARLRLENQTLREQLAYHLGTQRAAVNTSPH
jgi:regulator of replication initiation timing